MTRRRIALTAALAGIVAAGLPAGASARPWVADYPWQSDPTVGYEGWSAFDTDPDGGPDGNWYRSWLGGSPFGRGIAAQPLGGQLYPSPAPNRLDAGPRLRLVSAVPGDSRITSATFGDGELSNQPGEGQYLRARVFSATNPTGGTRDFGDATGQPERPAPYTNLAATLSNGTDATQAEGWLFTTCPSDPGSPGNYLCPTIPANTDSYGRWGDIRIELDDPDDPTVDVTGDPAITDGWTNTRRAQRLAITARDGSSGIARIRTQVQVGASTRTLADRTVTCDPDHRTTGRRGLVCPPESSTTATDPGRDSSSRDRRYTVTATDYAGNTGARSFTVRRDLVDPASGKLTGELTELAGPWTNKQGAVSATVRASDRLSGVSKVEVLARRSVGGRTTILGTGTPDCDDCRNVTERVTATLDRDTLPNDGRYRLSVRVTDRAGNTRTFGYGRPLRIDRTAPRRPGKPSFFRIDDSGRVRLFLSPGRDPGDGSGTKDFIVRYTQFGTRGGFRYLRVGTDNSTTQVIRRVTYRVKVIEDADPLQSISVTEGGCDQARFGQRQIEFGGASENCSPYRALRSSDQAEQITRRVRREIGLDDISKEADQLYRRAQAAKAARAATVARRFGRIVRVGGPITSVISALIFTDSTSCYDQPKTTSAVLDAVRPNFGGIRASVQVIRSAGPNSKVARASIKDASKQLGSIRDYLKEFFSDNPQKDCQAYGRAVETAEKAARDVIEAAPGYLDRVDQRERDARRREASVFVNNAGTPVGQRGCRDAKALAGRLRGLPRRWVVYWAFPPTPDSNVFYVGITNDLQRRCAEHRREDQSRPATRQRSPNLQTLNLPPLDQLRARKVEEALIAHFGTAGERANRRTGRARGQLTNTRHEFNPRRNGYCSALLQGQSLLRVTGGTGSNGAVLRYVAYAPAFYTRDTGCLGIGSAK